MPDKKDQDKESNEKLKLAAKDKVWIAVAISGMVAAFVIAVLLDI